MKICSRCGIELEDDMQYCPLCGEPAVADPEEAAKARREVKVPKWHQQPRRRPSPARILDLFRRVFHV